MWHIMKIYSNFGINDFIICLGYKGYIIKEYFYNYILHTADVTIDVQKDAMEIHEVKAEPWRVTLVDTGEHTGTAGRLRRISKYLDDETFCFTYGDGLADIDIKSLIDFHHSHNKLATVTAVRTPGRLGILKLNDNCVEEFVLSIARVLNCEDLLNFDSIQHRPTEMKSLVADTDTLLSIIREFEHTSLEDGLQKMLNEVTEIQ